MAYIGHPCACRHGDLNHSVDKAGKRRCNNNPCTRRCRKAETPDLLPTFDSKGESIERIVEPGQKLAGESTNSGPQTCDCDACQALYAELQPA
jgi:hypothetical protein